MLYLQNMWIERTIYVTAYKLPGILRWFEVKSVFMVRSIQLYWDCIKEWGSSTAREHLYFCMTVLQFYEQAISVAISGILRQGNLLAEGADWGLTEGDSSNAFPLLREGNVGWLFQDFRARSNQVLEVLLQSISGFQQVSHYSLWRKLYA